MYKLTLFTFCVSFLCSSCRENITNIQEFARYIKDGKNGMTNIKRINGLSYAVSYLPPEYLAMKDTLQDKSNVYDSAINNYKDNRTFQLDIREERQTNASDHRDINFKGINSFKQYVDRFYSMNFYMNELISLKNETNECSPLLFNKINTYGLSPSISAIFVFNAECDLDNNRQSKEISIVFKDEVFNNGKLIFNFKKSDLDRFSYN